MVGLDIFLAGIFLLQACSLFPFLEVFLAERGKVGFLPKNTVTGVTAVVHDTLLQGGMTHFVIRQVFILKSIAKKSAPFFGYFGMNPEVSRIAQAVSAPVIHAPQGILNA